MVFRDDIREYFAGLCPYSGQKFTDSVDLGVDKIQPIGGGRCTAPPRKCRVKHYFISHPRGDYYVSVAADDRRRSEASPQAEPSTDALISRP